MKSSIWHNELIYKTEIESHRKQNYSYQRERVGGINWEFGTSRYKPLYVKQIKQGPIV